MHWPIEKEIISGVKLVQISQLQNWFLSSLLGKQQEIGKLIYQMFV
jgi:hypothetical protein